MIYTKKEIDQIIAALDSTLGDEGINKSLIKRACQTLQDKGEVLFNLYDFLDTEYGRTVIVYGDANTGNWFALTNGETYRLENIEK